ncbi:MULTISPECIES: SMI1/KNR4 family protein [Streptomyces]|uniref:SMI1/KNR4 family protein n=2 Tax=Streptomyces TaxID=1883 RepID=A0ABV9IYA4_9ACTN
MTTDQADPAEPAALREAFAVDDDGGASALGWEAVRAFEAKHGVVLPEPYRTFVAEVSGGPSQGPPEYGLVGLVESAAEQHLGRPFPLTEGWVWEEDDGPYEDPDAVIGQVVHDGSLVLGTEGCGMDWHLVVTGPHRGRIWLVTGEGALPFGAGFAGWVKHWADGNNWFESSASVGSFGSFGSE